MTAVGACSSCIIKAALSPIGFAIGLWFDTRFVSGTARLPVASRAEVMSSDLECIVRYEEVVE